MPFYTVWSLDVWGNQEDGFEVNDRRRAGSLIMAKDSSDGSIVRRLVAEGFLRRGTSLSDVEISGDDEFILVDDYRTGEPVLQLTRK